jgi:hypothetical protein
MRSHATPMFRLLRTVLLFSSPLLLAPRLSSQQSSLNSSSCPCSLRGVVLDSVTGNPIHNAFVQVPVGPAWATLTDSEGKFQLDALPAGPLTVNAAKPGYLSNDDFGSSSPKSFSIQISPDAAPAILKLTPEGIIFGQVTDENGEPLEGFSVSLHSRNPMNLPLYPESRQRVLTDDEGNFRIAGLHPGFYYVAVHPVETPALTSARNAAAPQGFAPVFYPVAPDPGSATPIKVRPGISAQVNFSLKREPFVQLSGNVSGHSPDQQVMLNLQDSLGEPSPQKIAFDASTGTFRTKWLPPGSYTISAHTFVQLSVDASRSQSFASQLVNANSILSGIRLVLQPTVNIPVVVRGLPSDNPEQQQSLHFMILLIATGQNSRRRAYSPTWTTAPSDAPSASPSFMVEGVEPGSYELHAKIYPPGGYYVESASWGSTNLLYDPLVLDSSGAVPPIDISVREGAAKITGTVVSGDQPSSAVVVLFSTDERKAPEFAYAVNDGEFALPTLAPGAYRVIAINNLTGLNLEKQGALRDISSKAQEITLAPGQKASLRLEITSVGE